ncbi:MAG TPA: superoxide dismutase family protein [Pseudomonadales bacterium]
MRTLATLTGAALLTATLLTGGCGNSEDDASTPGEAITDRTAEPAPQSGPDDSRAAEPAREPTPPASQSSGDESTSGGAERIETVVIDSEGQQTGTLTVEAANAGVRLTLSVTGLQPGEHAVHFHEVGRCDPPDFESAGSHYNPHGARHGMPDMDEDPQDPDHHVGDMLNQAVDPQGRLETEMVNHIATLSDGPNTLLDEDGSALVIHARPDDYESQPSGNAGDRVACAVISRSEAQGTSAP